MKKIYEPKRFETKEIGALLRMQPIDKHADIKAKELAKTPLISNFSLEGIEVTILEGPVEENGLLKVSVSAKKNGVDLNISNPLLYKNPPIMVHDGTYHKEANPISGQLEDKKNFVEDPQLALKTIIVQTIIASN